MAGDGGNKTVSITNPLFEPYRTVAKLSSQASKTPPVVSLLAGGIAGSVECTATVGFAFLQQPRFLLRSHIILL